MKFLKRIVLLPLLLLTMQTVYAGENLVSSSWNDITNALIHKNGSPAPRVVNNTELKSKIAQIVDGKDIFVSGAFVAKLQASTLSADRQKEIMLFLLAHEVAHTDLPANSPDVEYQADFLASLFVASIDENYAVAGQSFFNFARDDLKADNTHGSAAEREQRLSQSKDEVRKLAAEFAAIMHDLSSSNVATSEQAARRLTEFQSKVERPGFAKYTGFAFAVAVARHKNWLLTAKNKDQAVQVSLFIPAHPENRRGSKGAKAVPGDMTKYLAAKKAYEKYFKESPNDERALSNYLTLIAYDGEDSGKEAKTLFEKLASSAKKDQQWLNNLGVAAYLLAESGIIDKGRSVAIFERAEKAKPEDEKSAQELEAKVVFNLARAYEQAGKQDEAKATMNRYRSHVGAEFCWRTGDFSCPTQMPKTKRPEELAGFRLEMTPAEIGQIMKSRHKDCSAGKTVPLADAVSRLDYQCGQAGEKFRFVFSSGRASLIQYKGLNEERAGLDVGSDKGKIRVGLSRNDVWEILGSGFESSGPEMKFSELGLIIRLDSGQKVHSFAIGDGTHRDKK